jgi:hypothetical protein
MKVTISRGDSFSRLTKVRAIVGAEAAGHAVEAQIRNRCTRSDIFAIEQAPDACG